MMLPGTSAVWHSIIKGYKFHCIVSTRLWLRCDYLRCKYSLKGERRIKGKSRGKTGDERKEKRVEHFGGFCGIQTKEVWASPTACPTQSIWTPCSTFPATPSYSLSSFITHLLPSFLSPSISCRIKTLLICRYRTTRPLTPNHQMQRALTHVLFLPFFFLQQQRYVCLEWQDVWRYQQRNTGCRLYTGDTSNEILLQRLKVRHPSAWPSSDEEGECGLGVGEN